MDATTLELARRVVVEAGNGTLSRSTALHLAGAILDASGSDDDSSESQSTAECVRPLRLVKPSGPK